MGKKFVDIPVDDVNECAGKMLEYFSSQAPSLYGELENAAELTAELKESILTTADKFRKEYNNKKA